MRVIVPGHRYELKNLKSDGASYLQFYQDAKIHGEHRDGTSCQEVIRALIDRVQVLDKEKPWFGNLEIVKRLRKCIVLFESRALMLKVEKKNLAIENFPVSYDGHFRIDYENTEKSV